MRRALHGAFVVQAEIVCMMCAMLTDAVEIAEQTEPRFLTSGGAVMTGETICATYFIAMSAHRPVGLRRLNWF